MEEIDTLQRDIQKLQIETDYRETKGMDREVEGNVTKTIFLYQSS